MLLGFFVAVKYLFVEPEMNYKTCTDLPLSLAVSYLCLIRSRAAKDSVPEALAEEDRASGAEAAEAAAAEEVAEAEGKRIAFASDNCASQ